MAWTAPMTATSNMTYTAANWNANVRDNFLETAPGKATGGGYLFVSTAANSIRKVYPYGWNRAAAVAVTSTTYVTVNGAYQVADTFPAATQAWIMFAGRMRHNTANAFTYLGVGLDGAVPNDSESILADGVGINGYWRAAGSRLISVSAGTHTWTLYAKTSTGSVDISQTQLHIFPL